ncbi:septation protein A [Sphingomonas sp. CJ99]
MTQLKREPLSPLARMAIDFGPLIVFFAVNNLSRGLELARLLYATAAFMVATGIAMAFSWARTRHVSPMLWISGALVLVFGGLTLYFQNETFIKVKPTLVYLIFSVVLAYGLATGRPLLKMLLESAYPGLNERGWRQLTINWALFFVGMALLNEAVWRTQTTDFWVSFKLFGAIPLTLVFAAANIPMLLKNGLQAGEAAKDPPLPPEG